MKSSVFSKLHNQLIQVNMRIVGMMVFGALYSGANLAATVETRAYFQISSASMPLCSSEYQCSFDSSGITIQTDSWSELHRSISQIRGLSTLDGLIHVNDIQWSANFPFAVHQLSVQARENGAPLIEDSVSYPYSSNAPDVQLRQFGADGIQIIQGGLFSGGFQVSLGYEDGAYPLSRDFRFEPVVVPLPSAIWLFGSTILGLLGWKKRSVFIDISRKSC